MIFVGRKKKATRQLSWGISVTVTPHKLSRCLQSPGAANALVAQQIAITWCKSKPLESAQEQLHALESAREQLHAGNGAATGSLLAIQLLLRACHTCRQWGTSCSPGVTAKSHTELPRVTASPKSHMEAPAGGLPTLPVGLCRNRAEATKVRLKESQASIC